MPDGDYTVIATLDTGPFEVDKDHENGFTISRN
jgi:hypothetical protein